MYKILCGSGGDMYYFEDKNFESATEAFEYARKWCYQTFEIIKIIEFKAVE